MNYYVDIKLLPDPELSAPVLMSTIYSKLHKVLSDLNSTTIGISFPKFNVTLCSVLRLHGTQSDLITLLKKDWLGVMSGYCEFNEIKPVPTNAKFRTVSRKQTTMSQSKLNRLIKRGSISKEDIKKYKAKMFSKGLDNPYVELVSGSNGHKHRRYIEFGELLDNPVAGEFDQFGLSKTATVPWF